jgi:hypothetical protein
MNPEVICPACGAHNPEGSQWCEQCLRRFDAAPGPVAHVARANAFARTASTTLTRRAAARALEFVEPGGEAQASVLTEKFARGQGEGLVAALLDRDSLSHLDERHTVVDLDDSLVFSVERYRAAQSSFVVFDPGGTPLAVYVAGAPVVVRDGTGAPVGRLSPWRDRYQFIETGGDVLAQCWRGPVYVQWLVDEEWGLTVLVEPAVLDRRALVAMPLICRLLWSDGFPRERTESEMLRS